MGSAGIPDPSPPFNPFKDCSQEICSVYCPQWCYILFTPPPPLFGVDDTGESGTYFSPLIVAVIGILASAFILVTYYAIVSKYCRRRGDGDGDGDIDIGSGSQRFENDRPISDGRQPGSPPGLDEALLKSISVYKFKKGDGLVDGTDCSVCLSEFQENESLRLLPKCSHAFHLFCIDTWLKSNSSCPLCRCNIAAANPEHAPPTVTASGYRRSSGASVLMVQDLPEAAVVEIVNDGGDESREVAGQPVNPSVADILSVSHEEAAADSAAAIGIGPSTGEDEEYGKSRNRSGVLNSATKKSKSSGIFVFTRYGKGKSLNLPV